MRRYTSDVSDVAWNLMHTKQEQMHMENKIMAYRAVIKLMHMLKAQMPRPNSIHKYSTGRMYANFIVSTTTKGWKLVLSEGVPYSHYALGFNDEGKARIPRGPLETLNFKTVPNCIETICAMIKEGSV